jgi:nitrogen fixation/metabolism regulation signal transduction histidine kinase
VDPPRRRLSHEARLTLLSLAGGLPAVAATLWFAWATPQRGSVRLTLTLAAVVTWVWAALAVRGRVVRVLQTLSNLAAALREGDTSIRARGADPDTAHGLAFHEMNRLAESLRGRRLDATEAMALLRRVMDEIDVAIFGFDAERRLRLVNRAGEALLDRPAERALGLAAAEVGLEEALGGAVPRLLDLAPAGRAGRWELRRGTYRWEGRPHALVVLSDLGRALRQEERLAWQRLVRVLSHEINNSLAPIKSLAGSLRTALDRGGDAAHADIAEGLGVIGSRAGAMERFLQAYARLTRLPSPAPRPLAVAPWARRVASLETRLPVAVEGGPEVTLTADGDQMEALLVNLVRNAADAALETGGGVRVRWRDAPEGWLTLEVEDDGPGIADAGNLFVPFYTTKPGGTGIGLSLCRQIAEAHGGTVGLAGRPRARGAIATLRLPLAPPPGRA